MAKAKQTGKPATTKSEQQKLNMFYKRVNVGYGLSMAILEDYTERIASQEGIDPQALAEKIGKRMMEILEASEKEEGYE